MSLLNYQQDNSTDKPIISEEEYTAEFIDTSDKYVSINFPLVDYEEAYCYCQMSSEKDGFNYVALCGGDLEQPLLFEDGKLVKS